MLFVEICDDLGADYDLICKWLESKKSTEIYAFWIQTYNQICAFQAERPLKFSLRHKHFRGQFTKHLRRDWGVPNVIANDNRALTKHLLIELQAARIIGAKDHVEESAQRQIEAASDEVKEISAKLARLCNNLHISSKCA